MPEDMGAIAVAEPVESAGAAETVETGAESVETPESGAETGAEVDSPSENDGLTAKPAAKGKLSLAEVVKTKGEALKAIDPALPAALRTAAYELSSLYREFQGGLKEAVGLKTAVSEYGGLEGIKEDMGTLSELSALSKAFFDGKPDFVDALIKESPVAFSQIMPDGLAKWKATDLESYNHHQAKVMIQTLDGAQVSATLESIWNAITDEKQKPLKDAVASLWHTLDGFRKMAEKAPERKVTPQDEALTKREQDLAAREERAMLAPVAQEGRRQIETITEREMTRDYKWAETDADVRDAVQERVRTEVINASRKDRAFTAEFERLKGRGDAAGLQKHVKNFQDRVTPAIVARVARLFAVKPKAAGTVVANKPVAVAANGNGNGAHATRDWERISAQPKFKDLDTAAMGRDYEDLILSGKGILKGGRKVIWPV